MDLNIWNLLMFSMLRDELICFRNKLPAEDLLNLKTFQSTTWETDLHSKTYLLLTCKVCLNGFKFATYFLFPF